MEIQFVYSVLQGLTMDNAGHHSTSDDSTMYRPVDESEMKVNGVVESRDMIKIMLRGGKKGVNDSVQGSMGMKKNAKVDEIKSVLRKVVNWLPTLDKEEEEEEVVDDQDENDSVEDEEDAYIVGDGDEFSDNFKEDKKGQLEEVEIAVSGGQYQEVRSKSSRRVRRSMSHSPVQSGRKTFGKD
ncbi:hypothetical protein L1987_43171 [Smallanthus sonchifolius]|uniref:Uncharacterized protein n=1 Tax=Smallanthus sonchifolius TaxID=185202 RepID=A0ACB9GKQ2_9ASTR|nr:hypothetical protein L1987_43171 [Smallanthus sonchifolius]